MPVNLGAFQPKPQNPGRVLPDVGIGSAAPRLLPGVPGQPAGRIPNLPPHAGPDFPAWPRGGGGFFGGGPGSGVPPGPTGPGGPGNPGVPPPGGGGPPAQDIPPSPGNPPVGTLPGSSPGAPIGGIDPGNPSWPIDAPIPGSGSTSGSGGDGGIYSGRRAVGAEPVPPIGIVPHRPLPSGGPAPRPRPGIPGRRASASRNGRS